MMNKLSPRTPYLIAFMMTALLLATTFYLQNYDGFIPCPLCILQRMVLVLLSSVCLIGSILNIKKLGRIFLDSLTTLVALMGVLLAGRQVWLQHLPPDKNADCGVSLQYLAKVLPFDQVILKVLQGTAECSQKGWEFLHLTLAEWSLICFIGFLLFGFFQLKRSIIK